jgi:hypothetical protein
MRKLAVLSVALLVLFALSTHLTIARTVPTESRPQLKANSAPSQTFGIPVAKSLVDTTYIFGGPGTWEGRFETPGGQADWHGWTHEDLTGNSQGTHWHVSTYWAEYIEGHGIGNHALYCGDETIPACDPPDTIGGVGPSWFDDIEWRHSVADTSQPVTVRLTGLMNFDLPDANWDFLQLFIKRGADIQTLDSWTGITDTTVVLDYTAVISPGEYIGPNGDEVSLYWRVWTSDDGWDDVDCISPSHGACQIDDLSVYFDDQLITFDDFEPNNPVNWIVPEPVGVGDFAHLRNDLGDIDPCRDNNTWQVNFVDNGVVVPGTGGTMCIQHCYDPNGYIVNNDGGLLANDGQDWFLKNLVISPPIYYPAGKDGAQFDFDVYRHTPLQFTSDAGIGYQWSIRSTDSSDPADLEDAPWIVSSVFYFGGPEFTRHEEPVGDRLVPGRRWVQLGLMVNELGWLWNINGPNGTPAPYFDNASLKVWDPEGPEISVRGHNLFGDAFPEAGILDPENLAANSCRVDMNGPTFNEVRGDSLVAKILPMRHGGVVLEDPVLHWVMDCNPVFDPARLDQPDGEGILRGMTTGIGTIFSEGSPVADHWTFDLPDNEFFFPGDRLRYYIIGAEDLEGDIRASAWPPDTTGVADFSPDSPFTRITEIRGLPTITQPVAGQFDQPSFLFCDDTDDPQMAEIWFDALEELGLYRGIDFDIVTIDRLDTDIRLDMTMNLEFFAGYQTMFYARGQQFVFTLADEDAALITSWLDLGNKQVLMAGDRVGGDLQVSNSGPILSDRLGVQFESQDIYVYNGGMRELQISPGPGNGVLPFGTIWQVYDGCPDVRVSNAITSVGAGRTSATLDPEGTTGGPYAAVVTADDLLLTNRSVVMPFGLDRVDGMTVGSAKDAQAFSPRAHLLNHLLIWLGADYTSPADDIPEIGKVSVSAHPNPFNPQTTIAFDLPRAMDVTLDIFDLQGRLVRSLLNENPYSAGSHKKVWDGRDGDGRATGSGVYFYKFTAGDQKRVGKLTLLK